MYVGSIWKRFLGVINGSSGEPCFGRQRYQQWASRLPRSAFVIWLAGHVADDLIHRKSRLVTFEQVMDAIDEDNTGMMQHDAERFIETYYFGYPSFDPQMYKLIHIFRRIVKRKIKKHIRNYNEKYS